MEDLVHHVMHHPAALLRAFYLAASLLVSRHRLSPSLASLTCAAY